MPRFQHIFLDNGGVMTDNRLQPPQWQSLVGEFFTPRLGGTPEDWAAANTQTFPQVFEWLESQLLLDGSPGWSYAELQRGYDLRWLRAMSEVVSVGAELSDDQCVTLSTEASLYITARIRAELPGAVGMIRELATSHQLFTASMCASRDLRGALEGMGVLHLFSRLYGPDLINAAKHGPNFYTRIFADAGVEPTDCVVLDDKAEYLLKARAAGAFPIRVGQPDGSEITTIPALANLPALLERLSEA